VTKKPAPRVNGNVLASTKAELVGCFYSTELMQIFTVDSYSLIRNWDLLTGQCTRSYPLEIPSDSDSGEARNPFQVKAPLHACVTDYDCRNILVAFEGGLIQIHNLASGELLFNRNTKEPLRVDQEVSVLVAMNELAPFWFMAGC
jgi:hypothetical protein